MKTAFKVVMFLTMFATLMITRATSATTADDYVKVHKGDTFVYNYSITYKNGTTSTGIAFIRVNAVENDTMFYNITWNQTTYIIFTNGIGVNITDVVPSNASISPSLVPFINVNVVNKSMHQVGNGTDCRTSWDADGVLLAVNASMNATTPGLVASQTITRFERRSLLPGYAPVIIVAIVIPAIAILGIKIKREMQR